MAQNDFLGNDPTELDEDVLETDNELDIDTTTDDDIEIDIDDEDTSFADDTDEDSDVDGDDDDEDGDEVKVEVKKPALKEKTIKNRKIAADEAMIRRVPVAEQRYRTKNFTIRIVSNIKKVVTCEVIASQPPCRMAVGEKFEAKEMVFYGEHYSLVWY